MANVRFHFTAPKNRSVENRQEAKEYGSTGEQIATRYLEDQGYVILSRNYRKGHKETDIIVLDHGEIAVIEVKTRSGEEYITAEQAVDHQKRQNIIRVADNYVRRYRRSEPVRFDIVAIIGSGENVEIRHTKNAFNAMSL